jgi:hypothetical protein
MKGTAMMLTDDELAAVERAIDALNDAATEGAFYDLAESAQRDVEAAATLRNLAERARNGGWLPIESARDAGYAAAVADVAAWLRAGEIGGVDNNAARKIAIAIEAGAHKETK